jgi:uncharacterized protein YaiI (UPF0178 family)
VLQNFISHGVKGYDGGRGCGEGKGGVAYQFSSSYILVAAHQAVVARPAMKRVVVVARMLNVVTDWIVQVGGEGLVVVVSVLDISM